VVLVVLQLGLAGQKALILFSDQSHLKVAVLVLVHQS
jgi:hypothetical protein